MKTLRKFLGLRRNTTERDARTEIYCRSKEKPSKGEEEQVKKNIIFVKPVNITPKGRQPIDAKAIKEIESKSKEKPSKGEQDKKNIIFVEPVYITPKGRQPIDAKAIKEIESKSKEKPSKGEEEQDKKNIIFVKPVNITPKGRQYIDAKAIKEIKSKIKRTMRKVQNILEVALERKLRTKGCLEDLEHHCIDFEDDKVQLQMEMERMERML
ncbi:uncharacterized protein [Erythrolamprus reginae]|uniref:uncharacterized protein n=1 Tax=Erythrolamprus reginae TaxID=121349 RepID=UPI00396C6A2F